MGQTASVHFSGVGTQLIKASKAGDVDAVTELVSSNPQLLRYCTFQHLGPCHYAAIHDHVEVLQQLVAKAQEYELLQCQTPKINCLKVHARLLGEAAFFSDEQQRPCTSLVKQLVNATNDRGVTPLMLAVGGGCTASVKLLLEKGADPWSVDKLGGRTALHYAARSDKPDFLELLVEAAGEAGSVNFPNRPNTKYVDVRTQTGFTAVHFAVNSNSQQALAVLLNLGANPLLSSLFDCLDTINCPKGTTALHLAARQGNQAIAMQLLRAYVEHWYHRHLPDPRLLLDGDNLLPCQVAARRHHPELARMLLPSNPITSLFADGDLQLLGPPSLAAIAGAVLRSTLAGDLDHLQQQQQQQSEQPAVHPTVQGAGSVTPDTAAAAVEVEAACQASDEGTALAAAVRVGSSEAASAAGSCAPDSCGVCFDATPQVRLLPCGHELCVGCCRHLLALNSRCVMTCPFCRAGVEHMEPLAGVLGRCRAQQQQAPRCGGAAASVVDERQPMWGA